MQGGGLEGREGASGAPGRELLIALQKKQWYYVDGNGNRAGPLYTRLLLHKVNSGELDGLTLVFGSNFTEWMAISNVPELKQAILKNNEEEEASRQALQQMEKSAQYNQVT